MRVLWVTNLIPSVFSEKLGLIDNQKEGWVSGMLDALRGIKEREGITLAIASPVSKLYPEGIIESIDGIDLYGFHENEKPEIYEETLEKTFVAIIRDYRPDMIHIFGTEFPHTRAVCECIRKYGENLSFSSDRVLIGMQGVMGELADHYLDGIDPGIVRRNTFRDIVKYDGLEAQKLKFSIRSQNEIIALMSAGHITGRTSFDRAYTEKWAKRAKYHFMNESLRSEFYEGVWEYEKSKAHTIFMCQANYPIKGMHYVLKALPKLISKYPDIRIRVAGDSITSHKTLKEKLKLSGYGKYLLGLEKMIQKETGIAPDISYLGKLTIDDMKREYLSAGMFLCPSTLENSPNSLGEAMLLGIPCVAANVGGIPDIIKDGQEGILYEGGNIEALENAIEEMFEKSPDELKALGEKASERARKDHDRDENLKTLIKIYKDITG